jgi:hypothetical protein
VSPEEVEPVEPDEDVEFGDDPDSDDVPPPEDE